MKLKSALLITFLGNYLTNTVVAAVVALIPASAAPGMLTPQYIAFVVLAAIVVGLLTMWYGPRDIREGAIFGAIGFLVALAVAFISGIAGVLTQTGSLWQVAQVVPNFWPFLASWSTLVLLGYWMIPATFVGWWNSRKAAPAPMM